MASQNADDTDYRASPFFKAASLNGAVLVKHRLRADEQFVFEAPRQSATKLIIPFERTDLSLGGRSLFVGQRGWENMLCDLRGDWEDESRDVRLLEAVDELPSLDPFLLREHLRRRDFKIASCYFAISLADVDRMQRFVAGEISKLVDLAYGGKGRGYPNAGITKLVTLLLSGEDDDRLDPLRVTLGLEGDDFREGVFCWKGFLYYKWALNNLWPEVRDVVAELTEIKLVGPRDDELLIQVKSAGAQVNQAILGQVRQVRDTLQVYDDAFAELTQAGNPMAFRSFLLKSPRMFVTLGERTGMVSHIASFWRYRFPKGRPLKVELDELADILQDFRHGLSGEEKKQKPTRPPPLYVDEPLPGSTGAEPIGKAM